QNPLHSREILNFLRRRPIFSRSYDDEPVFAQWRSNYLGRQLLPLGSKNEGCVQSPCAHAFQQFAAPSGAEPERDLWKLGSNPPERFGNSKLSQSVRHTDSYFPGREVAGGSNSPHFVSLVEQAPAAFESGLARRRQRHWARAPIQKNRAQRALQ